MTVTSNRWLNFPHSQTLTRWVQKVEAASRRQECFEGNP